MLLLGGDFCAYLASNVGAFRGRTVTYVENRSVPSIQEPPIALQVSAQESNPSVSVEKSEPTVPQILGRECNPFIRKHKTTLYFENIFPNKDRSKELTTAYLNLYCHTKESKGEIGSTGNLLPKYFTDLKNSLQCDKDKQLCGQLYTLWINDRSINNMEYRFKALKIYLHEKSNVYNLTQDEKEREAWAKTAYSLFENSIKNKTELNSYEDELISIRMECFVQSEIV